jgi:hypothetical protein
MKLKTYTTHMTSPQNVNISQCRGKIAEKVNYACKMIYLMMA